MKTPYYNRNKFAWFSNTCLIIGIMMMIFNALLPASSEVSVRSGFAFFALSFGFNALYWYANYLYKCMISYRGMKPTFKKEMLENVVIAVLLLGFSVFYIFYDGFLNPYVELTLAFLYLIGLFIRVTILKVEK